jgi:hypothetical protein
VTTGPAITGTVTAVQTCDGCPDQWEGTLPDGRAYYLRLRHGRASLAVGKTPAEVAGRLDYQTRYEPYDDCGAFQSRDHRDRVFAELLALVENGDD